MRSISCYVFCFQAEDGIRDLVRSRGLGDVYKRQSSFWPVTVMTRGTFQLLAVNTIELDETSPSVVSLSLIHI